ncbi:MAG: 3-oxoacyl-ACP reductase FabG [Sinobacteraceae bacterium]|nr:3-oxoacyl-ACP reductase FabG [Nevskia sp.]MDI3260331.1 3-oxoacyl-ACP reductase FabG [Nevskiaceae bacterium]
MNADPPRRWILVTGASRGIGRATALRLARDGFGVVVHCRADAARLEPLCAEIARAGGQARALAFELADRAACAQAIESDIAAHGAYYGAVCNAGLTRDTVFPGMSGEDWDAVLRANLDGFYNVLQPLLRPLLRMRRGGRIVVLSSASGVIGNRGQVNYSAAKAGLIGAAKALALELASRGVTVNCVAPGLIETDMIAAVPREALLERIPAGRVGTPEEVAALIAFLCSDAAAYITRQVIGINGGLI